ncbi:SPARC-like [Anneissia japonica]|uniref:SPARC-like n=1 Tax=Anneissia japonica TaxID=1529436 RepID=UPI001425B363|nr:SPARC-like [Anneissia japonica]
MIAHTFRLPFNVGIKIMLRSCSCSRMKLLVVLFLVCIVSAKKQKPRKLSSEQAKAVLDELTYIKQQQIYNIEEIEDEELEKEITKEAEKQVKSFIRNPCNDIKCNQGEICALNDNYEATCTCAEFCIEPEYPIENSVCDTNNVTYPSECEFYRRKCLMPKLLNDVELDYLGSCLDVGQMCSQSDLLEFPHQLQQWFYTNMEELTAGESVSVDLTSISQRESPIQDQSKSSKQFSKPLKYRFIMMDNAPQDRMLSHSELRPLRSPLVATQPCVVPFLNSCDTNHNSYIHIDEWLACFK